MRWGALVVAMAMLTGCDIEHVTSCDGIDLVCPAGLECHAGACASQAAIAACEGAGKLDGEDCSVPGAEGFFGFCSHGACVAAGCGDGVRTDPEQCEGADLHGATCETLGYYQGTLGCGATCLYDVAACSERCGDGAINGPELCDGAEIATASCLDFGFDRGRIACTTGCGLGFGACDFLGWRRLATADISTADGDGPGRLLIAQGDGQLYTVATATGVITPLATWPLGYHAGKVLVVGGVRYAAGSFGIDSAAALQETPTGWVDLIAPSLFGTLGTDGTSLYWIEQLVAPGQVYRRTGTTWTSVGAVFGGLNGAVRATDRMLILEGDGRIDQVAGNTLTEIIGPGPSLAGLAEAADGSVWGYAGGDPCRVYRQSGAAMVVVPTPEITVPCDAIDFTPAGEAIVSAGTGTYLRHASTWWRIEGSGGRFVVHDGVVYGLAGDLLVLEPARWESVRRADQVTAVAPEAAGTWLLAERDGLVRFDGTAFSPPIVQCSIDNSCWLVCEQSPGVAFATSSNPDEAWLVGATQTPIHIGQDLGLPLLQAMDVACSGTGTTWLSIGDFFGLDHLVRLTGAVPTDVASDLAIIDLAVLPDQSALVLVATAAPSPPGSTLLHFVGDDPPVTLYQGGEALSAIWGCAADRWIAAAPGEMLVQDPGAALAREPLAEFDRIKTLASVDCAPGATVVGIAAERLHTRTAAGWAPARISLPFATVAGGAVGPDGVVVFIGQQVAKLVEGP